MLCGLAAVAVRGDEPAADGALTIIDPVGQPKGYTKPVERATYFLWFADGEWHVRTRTKEETRLFAGVIRVKGGRVTQLTPEQVGPKPGKKGKPKRRKPNDIGRITDNGRTVEFSFETGGGREDGFDFRVNEPATAIEFDLIVKGFDHPERILIGKEGAHPAEAKFSLPAWPAGSAE